jgi:hypothetical protein
MGDEAEIRVVLDPSDRVVWSDFTPVQPDPVGLFDLLRWRWDHWRESRR